MTFVDRARDRMEWYLRGHNEHDWKSCDGQKPSEGSNPSHSAKTPNVLRSGFSFFSTRTTSKVTGMERNDAPGGSSLFLAASTVSFCGSETSLERVLTRKIVLYIFVCKTHKNGKIWSKFR